jgi:hypothetical protein
MEKILPTSEKILITVPGTRLTSNKIVNIVVTMKKQDTMIRQGGGERNPPS